MEEKGLEREPEGRIIFVNSYKGGAGKTTLSLSYCIDDLFHGKKYENVIYMDLDIQGTATGYLFEEGRLTAENCFGVTGRPVEVELTLEGETASLHVAHLNPGFQLHSSYGEEYFINHRKLGEELFRGKVMSFIRSSFEMTPKTLLVLDCSPGFSELEQSLLLECYQMAVKEDIRVEEVYVATLDAAHIKKCVCCLKDSKTLFGRGSGKRHIRLVLNDTQNYARYVKENEQREADQAWREISEGLRRELGALEAELWRWRYSEEIAMKNTYTSTVKLENQVDDYIFTEDKFSRIS